VSRGSAAIIPPRIARGQTLGIAAPSGPVRIDRLRRGLACLGDAFALRVADSITAPRAADTPSYLAASDQVRADELTAMLGDPDVRAIVLARGGYGLMRILPLLDPALLARDPKPIVGFSDATALLGWAHAAGVRAIHGPLAVQLGDLPPDDVAHLIALLTEPRPPGVRPWPLRGHAGGRAGARGTGDGARGAGESGDAGGDRGVVRGPLIAANLSLASLLVGTPWQLPLAGAIALLEEVGERPYEIDRYATQLALTGAVRETRAAVIGGLTRCVDPAPPSGERDPEGAALTALVACLAAAGVPAVDGAPVGHGDRNEAVPFGAACELDLDRGVLSILDAAVR
jgi:muramoyltetrapeptide carboxypeptidase